MADNFTILMEREKMDTNLLLASDPSLPHVMLMLNSCHPFAGVVDGKTVAVCLLEQKEHYYDIVNLGLDIMHDNKGYCAQIVQSVMDFVRSRGGRYIEAGCGNAQLNFYAMYQKLGFRVTGVWPDYYMYDGRTLTIENNICNRDMVRLRLDLNEKTLNTTGGCAAFIGVGL